MVLKRFTGKVQPEFLQRLMNQHNEPDARSLTPEQAEAKLKEAEANFNSACTRADVMRKEHLINLAEALARKNNTLKEAELKKLTQRSKQRKRAKKLSRARKKPPKGLAMKLSQNDRRGRNNPGRTRRSDSSQRRRKLHQIHKMPFLLLPTWTTAGRHWPSGRRTRGSLLPKRGMCPPPPPEGKSIHNVHNILSESKTLQPICELISNANKLSTHSMHKLR